MKKTLLFILFLSMNASANYIHKDIPLIPLTPKCASTIKMLGTMSSGFNSLRVKPDVWQATREVISNGDMKEMFRVVPSNIKKISAIMDTQRAKDYESINCRKIPVKNKEIMALNEKSRTIEKLYNEIYLDASIEYQAEILRISKEKLKVETIINQLKQKKLENINKIERINEIFLSKAPKKFQVIITRRLESGTMLGTMNGEFVGVQDSHNIISNAGIYELELIKLEGTLSRKLNNGFTQVIDIYGTSKRKQNDFEAWKNTSEAIELKNEYNSAKEYSTQLDEEIKKLKEKVII
ncbi:hypothetical protein HC000_17880 [Pseudoalteromonas sp. MIP2626]|uniref:hypothetical protein n=1 Tax=Pseudoalteromonas sp. MIP2626 TaxID=2705464 RepID=UPI0015CCDCF6|nr:hypothetical protein [Pseudoalteromonas sp. MIP2626]NYR14288.1 hypothetical protein [Pseudoalteromonas sp. MIP2626]